MGTGKCNLLMNNKADLYEKNDINRIFIFLMVFAPQINMRPN